MSERSTIPVFAPQTGQNSESARRQNLSLILRRLHLHGSLTRSELVSLTELNRTTVGALVGDLTELGFVEERAATPTGTPGRPSNVVELVPTSAVVLAIDIAVESIAVALIGLGGEILCLDRVERPNVRPTPAQTVSDVAALYSVICADAMRISRVVGIGVSVPGVIHRADGVVQFAPNLDWHDVPLAQMIDDAFGLDVPVWVGNDGDLGALAEHTRGAATGVDNIIYLTAEAGVSGGLIIDGGPMEGAAGYIGHVGHIPVNPTGIRCSCGAFGCWQTEVGEAALLRRVGLPESGGRPVLRQLLEAVETGDREAVRAVEDTARWLGYGMAGLVNILNPDLIVLAGVFASISEHARDVIDAEMGTRALGQSMTRLGVVVSALGDDGPLVGAAEMAMQPLLADPLAAGNTPRQRDTENVQRIGR